MKAEEEEEKKKNLFFDNSLTPHWISIDRVIFYENNYFNRKEENRWHKKKIFFCLFSLLIKLWIYPNHIAKKLINQSKYMSIPMSNILMFFIHIQYTQCGKIITIISNVSKGQDLMNNIKIMMTMMRWKNIHKEL